MRTIEQLNTLLEELEKRIRSISTAQKTLNQINEILAYIQSVQDYLQDLQTTFDSHVQECDDYSTDISNLQTQIDTINETINNLSTDNETTNQLKTSLSELQTKVDEFIGNSSTTAETLQNDISALQTDVGTCQDDIADVESEISAINSSIGEQNTTITNLQTTQTNLQTTQSSQASTINNLNSRLTTAENNISTLTGGVDVSEIDGRIDALEAASGPTCAHKIYNFHNATPDNFTFYTREYYYSCEKGDMIYQKLKLNYESTGEGILTITVYEEQAIVQTITVDLSRYSFEYEFSRQMLATKMAHNIMFKFESTTTITYKSLDLWLFAKNVRLYDYNQEVKVSCFNNQIYVTRYYDDCVKYGKFASSADIDLDNLPNTQSYNTALGNFRYMIYGVHFKYINQKYTIYSENAFFAENANDNSYVVFEAGQDDTLTTYYNKFTHTRTSGGEIVPATYSEPSVWYINNSKVGGHYITSNYPMAFNSMSNYNTNEWLFYSFASNPWASTELSPEFGSDVIGAGKSADGNIYLSRGSKPYDVELLCSGGDFLTICLKNKSTEFYVYVRKGFNTTKYSTTYSYSKLTLVSTETFEDCLIIYELCDGGYIKKTTTGWIVEPAITEPETITPQEGDTAE